LLGSILKHIRIFNHQTQSGLAKSLGISRSYISEIESNIKTPTIEVLQKYSDVFDIPLSSIMLFAEEFKDKKGLRKKAKSLLTKTAINFLDWICKEDEKK
jgi:transcriptional regulator with XRE-family HTH domain